MANKFVKFFVIGVKLWLLLLLAGLVLVIPALIYMNIETTNTTLALVLGLLFLMIEFAVAGWALYKGRKWVFKKRFF